MSHLDLKRRPREPWGRLFFLSAFPAGSERDALFGCTALMFLVTLVLGGSAWPRNAGDWAMEAAALPLLLLLVLQERTHSMQLSAFQARFVTYFPLIVMAALLAQLVPLPPAIWTSLPGRESIAAIFSVAGADAPWMPLALDPARQVQTILFFTALAIAFRAVIQLSHRGRLVLVALAILATGLSVCVALAQNLYGNASFWNFYGTATRNYLTGLYSSQNHFAALLYAVMPFVFVMALGTIRRMGGRATPIWICAGGLVAFLLLGVLMSRSRAGFVLTLASVAGSMLIFRKEIFGTGRRYKISVWAWILILALGVYVGDREFGRIASRFGTNVIDDYRGVIFTTTMDMIRESLPFGIGSGAFVDVYQNHEQPSLMLQSFVNFAHNDYLQILLEFGLAGAILLVIFLGWFFACAVKALRDPSENEAVMLGRAACLSMLLLLLHSTVEYPLRNASIAILFTLSSGCLLMARQPQARAQAEDAARTIQEPRRNRRKPTSRG